MDHRTEPVMEMVLKALICTGRPILFNRLLNFLSPPPQLNTKHNFFNPSSYSGLFVDQRKQPEMEI